ncbi:MAG: phosphogluconate dehydrogenase (NAD(+)-dependent, decarboxylating), partial [Solirubrobacteraceae bacterium]
MQVGMIGLGRMGANMARRLMRAGHECVVWDVSPDAVGTLAGEGATGAETLEDFAAKLQPPRSVCIMVPAGFVDDTIDKLAAVLERDDTIIDGGNSFYRDDIRRAQELGEKGIHYVDMGTSGGVFGLDRGYCLMIGGDDVAVGRLEEFFRTLAPGVDAAPRTPGAEGDTEPAEEGWLHCGPAGAGHFVKMVHNGIEYGMMAAYAEGLNILKHADVGKEVQEHDAETAPMREPWAYEYELPIPEIAEVWRRGSVVASWLLDLTAQALRDDRDLSRFSGNVSDSGEGRWTIMAAIDESVPAPVLSTALFSRFASRDEDEYANRL